jgi:hypothetical protein
MFDRLKDLWDNRGFELMIAGCLVFILLFSIYRKIKGYKGTWTKKHYIPSHVLRQSNDFSVYSKAKAPPRESKGELECRRVLQNIFKRPFNKSRPNFLSNPVTGGNFNLELDCYDQDLGIAVEYNGVQHYKFVPYFHRNKEAFLNQKYRDDMKRRICKEHGIVLIEVPYTIKVENIEGFIQNELKRNGVVF